MLKFSHTYCSILAPSRSCMTTSSPLGGFSGSELSAACRDAGATGPDAAAVCVAGTAAGTAERSGKAFGL